MELIDKGDHIYFELIRGYGEEYLIDYEINFNYVRYICRTDISYYYQYDLYQRIINEIQFHLEGENYRYYEVYHFRGGGYRSDREYIAEVLCKNNVYSYYVLHRANELDKDMINNINNNKYNLERDNIKILNYHDEYWRIMDDRLAEKDYSVDRSIKFEVINDDSYISEIFS